MLWTDLTILTILIKLSPPAFLVITILHYPLNNYLKTYKIIWVGPETGLLGWEINTILGKSWQNYWEMMETNKQDFLIKVVIEVLCKYCQYGEILFQTNTILTLSSLPLYQHDPRAIKYFWVVLVNFFPECQIISGASGIVSIAAWEWQ